VRQAYSADKTTSKAELYSSDFESSEKSSIEDHKRRDQAFNKLLEKRSHVFNLVNSDNVVYQESELKNKHQTN
jgi:hypothetical protein